MSKRKWTNKEIHEWLDRKNCFFYANKEDTNIFIKKRHGITWTLNWGNPIVWVIIIVVIVVIILALFL